LEQSERHRLVRTVTLSRDYSVPWFNDRTTNSLWWHGPTWLIDEDKQDYAKPEDYNAECCFVLLTELMENISLNPERYEHFDRLLRTTAYCILCQCLPEFPI
ncbi:hypothetical protein T11_17929, partial [Trichinella zimbabwensis]